MATQPPIDHTTVFEIDGHKVKLAPGLNDLRVTGMGRDGLFIEATWRRTYNSVEEAIEGGALVAADEGETALKELPDGSPVEWAFDGGPTMAEYDAMDAMDYQEMRDAGQIDD